MEKTHFMISAVIALFKRKVLKKKKKNMANGIGNLVSSDVFGKIPLPLINH